MKKIIISLSLAFSAMAHAVPGQIADFNYQLTDLAEQELSKENLFARMARRNVDLEDAICSNKAHVWAYQFSRNYGIKVGKIFMFFGRSVWEREKKGWMYHVAPYVIENGQEFVMEASYPSEVTRPLTVAEWLENETDGRVKAHRCREIFAADTDLTEYFYERYNLPEKRANGQGAVCYFRKVPEYYWFPASIALHDLKKDEDGDAVEFNPTGFDEDDVLEACIEIMTSKFGRFFGGGKNECKSLLGL